MIKRSSFIAFFLCVLLSGCMQSATKVSPETVAEQFFSALYVSRNAEAALALSTNEVASVLRPHQLASQMQRNVFGLPLTDAKVRVIDVETSFFRSQEQDLAVKVMIEGYQGHRWIREDRRVHLHRFGDHWRVSKLYSNPSASNG